MTTTDCTYVYFILSSVFYVIVAVCQLLIKDFLILIQGRRMFVCVQPVILGYLYIPVITFRPIPVRCDSERLLCMRSGISICKQSVTLTRNSPTTSLVHSAIRGLAWLYHISTKHLLVHF